MLAAFGSGDKRAFGLLYARYSKKLSGFISHRLNDRTHAADVAQGTWEEALRLLAAGHYKEEGKFFQWLCGIAVNKIKHLYRDEGHYVHPVAEHMEEIGGVELPAEAAMDRQRLFAVLKTALRKLGCHERTIVVLRFFRKRSFEEIAARMNISITGATSLCSKALRQLREHVAL